MFKSISNFLISYLLQFEQKGRSPSYTRAVINDFQLNRKYNKNS